MLTSRTSTGIFYKAVEFLSKGYWVKVVLQIEDIGVLAARRPFFQVWFLIRVLVEFAESECCLGFDVFIVFSAWILLNYFRTHRLSGSLDYLNISPFGSFFFLCGRCSTSKNIFSRLRLQSHSVGKLPTCYACVGCEAFRSACTHIYITNNT